MEINLFEVIAQIINFFILLVMLQKVFYKPINDVMEKRQDKIDELIEDSRSKMSHANKLIEEYEQKLDKLESEEKNAIKEARQKAEKIKDDLLEDYKSEADRRRMEYFKEIEDDKRKLSKEIQTVLGQNSVKIARRILTYVTDEALEEKYFTAFVEKIKKIDKIDAEYEISLDEEYFEVISATELSTEKKDILKSALKSKFNEFKSIDYTVDESMIIGYELRLESYAVNSSLKKYLDQIELNILKTIEAKY
ncbi:F0F1 ATP synthase subunit delta [Alkalibacter mobilis]|uniref:F0F1 ATP synthase subunit delta n=1 Tax=Alkalibacter mobilis TaxID=2787712 RepID=UPI00189D0191|nr:F0F1 ATP synthase subunit delta [Alkalibacter mobilis]MBF7096981.1 F0F1 ATP synthase subunit delta [Alkalibacter mobilis]